jgi:hypothetical protein
MNETIELSGRVARARRDLHPITQALQAQERLLLSLAELLPPDTGDDDLEEMPEHTELRSVILCVVKDCLQPAIEDLLAVAGPPTVDPEAT